MKRSLQLNQSTSVAVALVLLSFSAVAPGADSGDGVIIDRPLMFFAPYSDLIWEQPPIERDALSKTPFFCGWDEPAYDEMIPDATEGSSSQPMDDFRCPGNMPITSIHWWGSYSQWQSLFLPPDGPDAWQIAFWANTPADAYVPYSRPGIRLQQFEVTPEQVYSEWAGFDHFPNEPQDSCFRYSLTLDPTDYFWPDLYDGDIFWISITALYRTQKPDHQWGWKTRPWIWMGGAMEIVTGWNTTPAGLPISFANILQIKKANACGRESPCDMAFALDTDPIWIKWEQPFTGLRDWPYYEDEPSAAAGLAASSIAMKCEQEPDMARTGMDVDATTDDPKTWSAEILADDYECTLTGPVTQIAIWGSYYADVLPGSDHSNVQFVLSIRENVPASSTSGYSMPGKILWTRTFKKGQFTVQEDTSDVQMFYSPSGPELIPYSHKRAFKYTFPIDPSQAFIQTGTGTNPAVYWLSVQAHVTHVPPSIVRFGWKTSAGIRNHDAVWASGQEPYSGTWKKLNYPTSHPRTGQHTALAFLITTSDQSPFDVMDRQVADDWQGEQSSPVVAAAWWGSYLGYTDVPCECDNLAEPVRPDYFLLSIWSDVPRSDPNDPQDFGHPGEKLWEYEAHEYDEVAVGSDGQPGVLLVGEGREVAFRYSVRLPTDKWFTEVRSNEVYWFSVVAVYTYPAAATYPWGWSNHKHTFNSDAVAGSEITDTAGKKVWTWQPIQDRTGAGADMSFVLLQQAQILGEPPIMPVALENSQTP
jgi:hypothetical protein